MPGKPRLPPGTRIGKYRVDTTLGHGAMATVYLAEDLALGGQVAVKVLRAELAVALGPLRFRREVEILGRLHHPNIVPVLDAGQDGVLVYLVMPYVAGENLRARLMRSGPMPVDAAVAIGRDVAAAIDYAHRLRVLHRDIKPENILLHADRALVCDFGLARALDAAALEPLSSSGLILGTPAYMSPEQAMGGVTDAGSDIYALGCVMYEMLTGELPFTGATRQAILARQVSERPPPIHTARQDVPEALEQAVMRALAGESRQRQATSLDLFAGLQP